MKISGNMLIDLSHQVSRETLVYPGDPPLKFITEASIEIEGYRLTQYSFGSHTGTHIDAPSHLIKEGKSLDEFPLDHFVGRACTLDCSNTREIPAGLIEEVLGGTIPEFLLLYTAADEKWGTDAYFRDYPVLSDEAADLLAGLPLKGLGIDAPSFDLPEDTHYPIHKKILRKDILLLENLTRLNQTLSSPFTLFCFPLNLRGADASLSRICALTS
ncbi:MAG: cyclase family protein [Bacteroidales bacterium]|nr:cyclase family protein [Bacteroidales bacterium]